MRVLKLVQCTSELKLVSGLNWLWRHVIPTIENIHWSCCIHAAIPTTQKWWSPSSPSQSSVCARVAVRRWFLQPLRSLVVFLSVIATFAGDQVLRDCPKLSSEEESLMESLQSRLCLTLLRAATSLRLRDLGRRFCSRTISPLSWR